MADNGNTPKKEMSMEMRLLLAFLLMGVVMFVTQTWFKPKESPQPVKPAADVTKKAETAVTPPPETTVEKVEKIDKAASPVAANATPQQKLPLFSIDTKLFHVTFSNQGATVRSWQLKTYKGNDGKVLDFVNSASPQFPFSLYFPGDKPSTNVNWAWFSQTGDGDGLGVSYEFSDGHTLVRKSFRFEQESYVARVATTVTIDGRSVPHLVEWRGGFGDLTVPNAAAGQRTLYFDVAANKLVEQTASAAKNGPVTAGGNYSFAGIADTYFAAVFLPAAESSMQVVTSSDTLRNPAADKPEPFAGVAVGATPENRLELFVGPKDLDLLARVNPKLVQVVDFGWLSILAKPLFLLVNWFNHAFVHNFGWAIVIVTIVINFILFPLKLSNMKSMRKMQALKPQIDAINAKFKNLKMTDPKKAEQNQEVMDLYKKHGVNPMGGCMPMLLQIPFFFAFYKVFTVSVEMRGAPWLWVPDLSQPEPGMLGIKLLPLAMIASQFYMQKMTPQANVDPNQQRMMMFMPLIFGAMFWHFPSGLVLYYLTSNLVSMGQQVFFNRTESAQAAARSVEPPKKKNGRK